MKVALVHDYLKEVGGAEKVLMALKEIWPEAPVFTAYKFPKYWGEYRAILESWDIRESWGGYLPWADKLLSYYTIISPLFFKYLDLSSYDVVIISATGGYFPNGIKVGSGTKIITYCHTPPRFLYGYPTARQERNKWYFRPISLIVDHVLRMVDFKWAQRPGVFVANSKNVANRIRKFYRREARVVYPPITPPSPPLNLRGENDYGDYYLIVSRIVGSKNIELAVMAANKYKFKLKVAGRPIGSAGEKIASEIKGPTVEYLGEVTEEQKQELLAGAKGFLALESESDFGMTTVEPMMYGTPAIAFRNGGYLETVVDPSTGSGRATGIFFDELTPEGLWKAIKEARGVEWDKTEIRKWAGKFSKERFKNDMVELVKGYV